MEKQQSKQKVAELQLKIQYSVANAISQSDTVTKIILKILKTVSEDLGWSFADYWYIDRDLMRCLCAWHKKNGKMSEFEKKGSQYTFQKGKGLPGRIWASKKAAWVIDVTVDNNFPRAPLAIKAGLHGTIGFPILINKNIVGVMEFFSSSLQKPDQGLLKLFQALGKQIGLFMQRKEAERALEEINERKNEFISMASHELKTPITTLKVIAELLKHRLKKKPDSQYLYLLTGMDEQLSRLTRLIDDLLDINKIEQGKLIFKMKKLDINKLIKKIVTDMHYHTKTHKIKIVGEAKNKVMADMERIRQVLINLLSNAIKYSPKADKIVIRVGEDADCIKISVQDYGFGITKQDQKLVFNRFYRANKRHGKYITGFGLGLYISNEIVKRHAGKLLVESTLGKGSIFSLTIPHKAQYT